MMKPRITASGTSWRRRATVVLALVLGPAYAARPTFPARTTAAAGASAAVASPEGMQPSELPACAPAATRLARPPEFPATFPLPPGTVIVAKEERSGGRIILRTLVPGVDVRGVALFFERELPPAGFRTTHGESEPGEAEASFEGQGFRGRWKVNHIPTCPGAVTLDLVAGRWPPP
jgi:hypothetical protein